MTPKSPPARSSEFAHLFAEQVHDYATILAAHYGKRKRSKDGPWVMEVPVLSTTHLTEDDNQRLADGEPAPLFNADAGYILVIEEDPAVELAEFSSAFRALVTALRDHLGYAYVRFDMDGEIIAGLPTFDW